MSDPDPRLSELIDELRRLCEEYGAATARAALDSRAARRGLSPEERALVEAGVFGGEGRSAADVSTGDTAGLDVRNETRGATEVDGTLYGAAVGVNQGTVQLFFGARPPADGKELLDSYLRTLIADHGRLRLGKLLGKQQSGREQATMPPISLLKVFTSLTTEALLPAQQFTLAQEEILVHMDKTDPAMVLPEKVRVPALDRSTLRALLPDGHAVAALEAPVGGAGA